MLVFVYNTPEKGKDHSIIFMLLSDISQNVFEIQTASGDSDPTFNANVLPECDLNIMLHGCWPL